MKTPNITHKILALAALLLPMLAPAANVSLTGSDAINTSSLNTAGKWSNTQAPSAANDSFTSTYFMRTPVGAGNYTFAGNSLTLQAPAGQAAPMRSIIYKYLPVGYGQPARAFHRQQWKRNCECSSHNRP